MTTELDRWVKNQKIAVFHWTFQRVGGGEILASYLGKALDCKVYCMGQSKLGFEDLSYLLPRPLRIFKRVRSLEYILWSSVNIEELGDFDIIVTSGATTRAIITPEHTMHVHFCHSPPRWLYDLWNFRRKRITPIKRFIIDFIGEALRIWDYAVDTRVDYYFVNSEVIRFRLWKYLKRDSVVLYPPIEWNKYKCNESEDFILFLSRLEPEKRVFESIEACIRAGQKIVVAGTGTLEKQVREKYENHPLVDIKGFVDEKEKIELFSRCKAVIFPAVAEDFGLIPIEALASGKPVIVDNTGFPPILLNKTGFVEQNGVFKVCRGGIITRGDVANLATAVKLVDKYNWDLEYLRNFAKQFDFESFKVNLILHLKIWKKKFDKFRLHPYPALKSEVSARR